MNITGAIIAIVPHTLVRDPRFAHLRSPVTIEHTLIKCPHCGRDCWTGPRQLETAKAGGGQLACYFCIMESGLFDRDSIVGVNPDIEDVPRRNGQP